MNELTANLDLHGGILSGVLRITPVRFDRYDVVMTKIQARVAISVLVAVIAALALGGWANSGSGQATPSPSSQPSASTDASVTPSESPTVTVSPSTTGETYLLTVSISGAANGVVQSTPAGINCPTHCSARFPAGTVVSLTPMASAPTGGYETRFNGFSGACAGTTCTVTVNQSATVAASFSQVPVFATLTVVKSGTGAGGLFIHSMIPPVRTTGIYCGDVCSYDFQLGSTVTLYVVVAADPATMFTGWTGACTGTAECVLTITGPVTVTATYSTP